MTLTVDFSLFYLITFDFNVTSLFVFYFHSHQTNFWQQQEAFFKQKPSLIFLSYSSKQQAAFSRETERRFSAGGDQNRARRRVNIVFRWMLMSRLTNVKVVDSHVFVRWLKHKTDDSLFCKILNDPSSHQPSAIICGQMSAQCWTQTSLILYDFKLKDRGL